MRIAAARHTLPAHRGCRRARETVLDLHFIESVLQPGERGALPSFEAGDAFLAGGTWLFSEPQPGLRRLIDLPSLGWAPVTATPDGDLAIAATCRLAELEQASRGWKLAELFRDAIHCLWGSFKVLNAATVGGNLCLALPAGPMAALMSALDAECLIWTPDGGERRLPAAQFVIGAGRNALAPGEILRALQVPAASLGRRYALRQASLTRFGRSAALLIGSRAPGAPGFSLTVTAAVQAPLRLQFATMPDAGALHARLAAALAPDLLHDDVHGAPDWKRHMALLLAGEIGAELG